MSIEEKLIQRCFELALKARGLTHPNPLVGSVIVKAGEVISEGYHRKSGEDHAELDAIKKTKQDLKGATLYCNLEPCSHTDKKTPPCAQRIIKEGIKKVVIANIDPNKKVAGNGVRTLKEAGIEVITGALEKEGAYLNRHFFTHITKKRPYLHLKWAQTPSAIIGSGTSDRLIISGPDSLKRMHHERSFHQGIMIGKNTALLDDPALTERTDQRPHRELEKVILAPKTSSKEFTHLKMFKQKIRPTMVTSDHPEFLEEGELNFQTLLSKLYQRGICSLYVEGGARLLSEFLRLRLYDEISVYVGQNELRSGVRLDLGEFSFANFDKYDLNEDQLYNKVF